MYMCVCVCVCIRGPSFSQQRWHKTVSPGNHHCDTVAIAMISTLFLPDSSLPECYN